MQLVETECSQLGRSSPIASGNYNEALAAFQQADALIRSGSPIAALPFLDLADQKLAATRRELLSVATDQFMAPISNPLYFHVSTLPMHWQLAMRMSEATWNPNALPGGDFENLEHMEANGWRYSTSRNDSIETEVSLDVDAKLAGNSGLRLIAKRPSPENRLVQSSPLLVESAPVHVNSSQMILIHGWVRIDSPLADSFDGLLIYDSLGGRILAYRFLDTAGAWREFKLYRAAGEATDFRVTFELNGLGTVSLDEVTVRTVDLKFEDAAAGISAAREENLK
ncbi:MAG: hypothetical protein R3C03_08700 [Pirellulaceae bacterium]